MVPSFLTMAVIGADAAAGANATRTVSGHGEPPFGWMYWLIILTVFTIVALTVWHLLAARRRRIERLATAASLGHAPTRPGHRHPAHRT